MNTLNAADQAEIMEHLPTLRRYTCSLARNSGEGEDVAQEAVLRALENWDKFTPGSNLRAWLFRISRNIHYDRCRRRSRWNTGVKPILTMDDQSTRPNQDSHIHMQQVQAACETLTDDHRQVINLVSVEGLDYETAAERLGISVGTVKSRLSRARNALKTRMGDEIALDASGVTQGTGTFYVRNENWPETQGNA